MIKTSIAFADVSSKLPYGFPCLITSCWLSMELHRGHLKAVVHDGGDVIATKILHE